MPRLDVSPRTTARWFAPLAALCLLAGCGSDDTGATGHSTPPTAANTSPVDGSAPSVAASDHAVDVAALTADTVCDAVPVDTVAAIVGRQVSIGEGQVGACEWKAPEAVRVRLYPPGEWDPDSGAGGYRELAGIGAEAYVAKGTFDNGFQAEALLSDRAVAAIIPADWATEDMAVALLRAAVERLG